MDAATVSKLEEVAGKLAPQSRQLRYRHLFTSRDFELFEATDDYEAQRKKLEIRREEAVREILSESGVEGVIESARSVGAPVKVGAALGVVGDSAADHAMLTAFLGPDKSQHFVAGFIRGRLDSKGWEWVDALPIHLWDNPAKEDRRGTLQHGFLAKMLACFGKKSMQTRIRCIRMTSLRRLNCSWKTVALAQPSSASNF